MTIGNKEESLKDNGTKSKVVRRRKKVQKSTKSLFPAFMTILTIGMMIILFSKWYYTNPQSGENIQASTVTVAQETQPEYKETFIIEFDDQTVQVLCRGYDYNWERMEWNASIEIMTYHSKHESFLSGQRLVIHPRFDTFDMLFEPGDYRGMLDDIRCRSILPFVYNLTISGKTINAEYYIDTDQCKNFRDCGILEEFKRLSQ